MIKQRRANASINVVALVALVALTCPAGAQTTLVKATITVAPIILAEPMVETPIVIDVGPPEALPRNCFLRVKGLPPQSQFSDGHSVTVGTWALPITGLAKLKLTVPLANTGRTELLLTLIAIDGAVLAEAKTIVAVTAGAIAPTDVAPVARSAPSASLGAKLDQPAPARLPLQRVEPPTGPAMKPEERERALKLLSRGDAELAGGDVASARLLYQRAADAGLAEAAMALGTTFDPSELYRRGVKGLKGDPDAARKWYERARGLGASGADERLRKIGPP